MRRWRMGGFAIALLTGLGLGGAAAAADPPPDDSRSTWQVAPCWRKWFHSDDPPAAKPTPKTTAQKEPKEPADKPTPRTPSAADKAADKAASERAREEKAYLRRLAVCLKLHEIAEATKDEELEQKACELDQRIWAVYTERSHKLAKAHHDDTDVDEEMVEKHLGPDGDRGTPSDAPSHTVRGRDQGSRAEAREEKP